MALQSHSDDQHVPVHGLLRPDEAASPGKGPSVRLVLGRHLHQHLGTSTLRHSVRARSLAPVRSTLAHCAVQGTALYFFQLGVTDKFLTPEESKLLNKPCVLFNYFDYHGMR
jgi:hypothetical protein